MNALIGVILVIAGVVVGLYVGVWWAFVGGIVDVINEVRAVELDAMNVAIGVAKIVFAVPIGWLAAVFFMAPGAVMLGK